MTRVRRKSRKPGGRAERYQFSNLQNRFRRKRSFPRTGEIQFRVSRVSVVSVSCRLASGILERPVARESTTRNPLVKLDRTKPLTITIATGGRRPSPPLPLPLSPPPARSPIYWFDQHAEYRSRGGSGIFARSKYAT